MQIFLSKYLNNIDKKGRISVPPNYRMILNNQNGLIIYPSIKHKCLEACSVNRLEELSKIIQNLDPYSEERDAFETIILGESVHTSFDKEGRVIIPKALSEYANLADKGYFVGKGLVFEIWNPDDFDQYLSKASEIAKSNRHMLKNIGGQNE